MANLEKTVRTKWILLAVLCLGSIALLFVIYLNLVKSNTKPEPTNFAECIENKDARLLESYPEQCVVDGKSFTNPNQRLQ